MNQKIILPLLIIGLLVAFVTIGIFQYRGQRVSPTEPVPVIPTSTARQITRPEAEITSLPGIPPKTNIVEATKNVSDEVSLAEKDKVFDYLPIREEDFPTSAGIATTINVYSFDYDPVSTIRIEIYGINYNNPDITGPDAIAFKESFMEVKKQLGKYNADPKNLQIIFGNRQYIQDTATYWLESFNLL